MNLRFLFTLDATCASPLLSGFLVVSPKLVVDKLINQVSQSKVTDQVGQSRKNDDECYLI